ncbi:MAG: HD domain-containing phosphohydrolase [Pseudomonadota bacterium]
MYRHPSVNQLNLLLSLSDALDLASPELSQHQLRTAFIVWEMGQAAGLPVSGIEQLFTAALFHDVGALSPDEKINLHTAGVMNPGLHCILGEILLGQFSMFRSASRIVRFHHTDWQHWDQPIDNPVAFQSQTLMAADLLERSINRRQFILHQDRDLISRISSLSGQVIHPRVVEIFQSVSAREDFWLDLVSPRLYSILLHHGPCRAVEIDQLHLLEISELFRNLIDFRSRFTATHSSGVAGNLHDLGKMAVPNKILEKPDKLTPEEFAVMRQHTYFTYSVLNTIGGVQQIAEWAAFHMRDWTDQAIHSI